MPGDFQIVPRSIKPEKPSLKRVKFIGHRFKNGKVIERLEANEHEAVVLRNDIALRRYTTDFEVINVRSAFSNISTNILCRRCMWSSVDWPAKKASVWSVEQ
jgi:hypothetical protein